MKRVRLVRRKIEFEKVCRDILNEIKDLDHKERACFFYFFSKNRNLFFQEKPLNDELIYRLIFVAQENLSQDFGLESSEKINKLIITVYSKFVKNNKGTSANYFGSIALILAVEFLSKIYTMVTPEVDIYYYGRKLNNGPIDIICGNTVYDLFESKFSVKANVDEIIAKINEYNSILSALSKDNLNGKPFLTTLDFNLKENIKRDIQNCISTNQIFNAEDIFDIKIIVK